jgi:hypothetical protein
MVSMLWTGTTTPASFVTDTAGFYHCAKFHVTGAGLAVTKIRWYRGSTGSPAPSRLVIQDFATGQLLVECPVPDSLAVGWQEATITPMGLTSGRTYAVCSQEAINVRVGFTSPAPTPDSPLTYEGQVFGGPNLPFPPTGSSNGDLPFLDVVVDTAPSGTVGPELTPTDIDSKLVDWLADTGDNTHRTGDSVPGLPDRTKVAVDALQTQANGASGFDAIKAVADAVAAAVSGLPGTIASAVTTITGQLTSMTGTMFDTGLATIGSISHDMAGVINNVLKLFEGTSGGTSGALSGRTAFPTELWTMTAEADQTGPFVYAEPADIYVLTVTDADGQPPTVVEGVNWYPRIGWWCPFNGTQGTDRRFWDFGENELIDGGRRMPGVLVWTKPGVQTHIQAWALT